MHVTQFKVVCAVIFVFQSTLLHSQMMCGCVCICQCVLFCTSGRSEFHTGSVKTATEATSENEDLEGRDNLQIL